MTLVHDSLIKKVDAKPQPKVEAPPKQVADPVPPSPIPPRIVVMGLGGGGCNAVESMLRYAGLSEYVRIVACNTDLQALSNVDGLEKIQLGKVVTRGLGAGGDPAQGATAAQESLEAIRATIEGADMLFIACGEGGGTGTGSAPVVAALARDLGILTVAVVTKPFDFEGRERMRVAEEGIANLQSCVDAIVVIPNQNILNAVGHNAKIHEAFAASDNVLANFVASIVNMLATAGKVNVDFRDVYNALTVVPATPAMVGVAEVEGEPGEERGRRAAEEAMTSQLIESCSLKYAPSVIVCIEGDENMTLHEVSAAVARIQQEIQETPKKQGKQGCKFLFGTTTTTNPQLAGKLRVTIIATLNPAPPVLNEDVAEEYVVERPSDEEGYGFDAIRSHRRLNDPDSRYDSYRDDPDSRHKRQRLDANEDEVFRLLSDKQYPTKWTEEQGKDEEKEPSKLWWSRFAKDRSHHTRISVINARDDSVARRPVNFSTDPRNQGKK